MVVLNQKRVSGSVVPYQPARGRYAPRASVEDFCRPATSVVTGRPNIEE
ncbi:MAG: hypothetical protein ACI9HK_004331, partial [Pirellulaceae bacterium]